jgi:hypothetical protein
LTKEMGNPITFFRRSFDRALILLAKKDVALANILRTTRGKILCRIKLREKRFEYIDLATPNALLCEVGKWV